MTSLRCPVCGEPLFLQQKSYRCKKGHSFDLSREGYCNLILSGRRHSKTPGDNQDMARARNQFFAGDHYRILLGALSAQVLKYLPQDGTLVDAGCGEGYYTAGVFSALQQAGRWGDLVGVDLSKFALRYAAKREPGVRFLAASIFALPLFDQTADMVMNIFAPVADREFYRVLRPGGVLAIGAPGPRHLFGPKEVLYNAPYENEKNSFVLEGFSSLEVIRVTGEMRLESKEDIAHLFMMTPYYWKSPKEGCQRLESLHTLSTPIQFEIHLLKKTS